MKIDNFAMQLLMEQAEEKAAGEEEIFVDRLGTHYSSLPEYSSQRKRLRVLKQQPNWDSKRAAGNNSEV